MPSTGDRWQTIILCAWVMYDKQSSHMNWACRAKRCVPWFFLVSNKRPRNSHVHVLCVPNTRPIWVGYVTLKDVLCQLVYVKSETLDFPCACVIHMHACMRHVTPMYQTCDAFDVWRHTCDACLTSIAPITWHCCTDEWAMPHVTCHCDISPVTCHMTHVTCHASHVTCHMSLVALMNGPSTCKSLTSAEGCCSVLQCVAVCCDVLRCVAVCCGELQGIAVCCSVLQKDYQASAASSVAVVWQ